MKWLKFLLDLQVKRFAEYMTPKKQRHELLVGVPYGKSKITVVQPLWDRAGYGFYTGKNSSYREMSNETAIRLVRAYRGDSVLC